MVCCFGREFPSAFTHWFQSLSRISVESLHLSFECIFMDFSKLLTFSLEVLSQSSSLEHLVLQGCVVLSSPKVRFNSLITLTLNVVVLTSGHLEGILSSCSNLQRLTIVCCKLPYKLRLTGTLMVVVIWDCIVVKEIDLHAAHLRMLEYKIYNKVRFFFSFVPVLENVMVWGNLWYSSYLYVFGDCARDLPDQVKSLTLQFTPDQVIKLPTTRERRRPPPSPTRHTELKQVTYGGFNGLDTEMEFVLYILRCAAVLEQMFLSPGYKSEFFIDRNSVSNLSFDEEKRNLIQQRLHGQAIPGKATVIIQ
ncbi:hypothetical protein FXO38_34474 [Capsicum annuum]|nr:hypothetical protein FXO38_34474 [Capsicum annuum]